jgi:hypothetical protein
VRPASPSARLFAWRQQAVVDPVTLRLADRLRHADGNAATDVRAGRIGSRPGFVLGVPLCVMAIGLLLGREDAWIPGWFREHPIAGRRAAALSVLPR